MPKNIYIGVFNETHPTINLFEYFSFIESHRTHKQKFKTSNHHILPRWAFPQFSNLREHEWNSVHLTHIDHLNAHVLLARLWPVFQNTNSVVRMLSKIHNINEYQDIIESNNNFIANNNSIKNKEKVLTNQHNFQQESHKELVRNLATLKIENGTSNISKENINKKFGVDNVMMIKEILDKAQKSKIKTLQEKYNVDHNWAIPGEVKKSEPKKLETMMKLYGVEYIQQLPHKIEESRERWITNNPMFNPDHVISKTKTMIEKYGCAHPIQNSEILKRIVDTRKLNESGRPKFIWFKHETKLLSLKIRDVPEYINYLTNLGFVRGRGIKGYSSTSYKELLHLQEW